MAAVSYNAFIIVLASLYLTADVFSQGTINGPSSSGNECCGLHLMDTASSHVVIETSRSIGPSTYSAIRLRVCTTDSVLLQIWRKISESTYELRWQLPFTPSSTQTTLTYVIIPLSSSITTNAADRLGFFSTGDKLLIPFSGNRSATTQLSTTTITNLAAQLTVGQTVTLDSYLGSRSFQSYIVFCTQSDCSDHEGPTTTTGLYIYDTVLVGDGQCCDPTVGCDPTEPILNSLASQTLYVNQLQDQLNNLTNVINSLISRGYVTGLCPQGFLSGRYGVGSCYLMFRQPVTLAGAFQSCRTYGAYLLAIESELEERFIEDFIGNNSVSGQSSIDSFWTAGLYDVQSTAWFWFSSTTSQLTTASNKRQIFYSKWLNNTIAVPNTQNDICLLLNIDHSKNQNYWANGFCSLTNYYICEIPKQCL